MAFLSRLSTIFKNKIPTINLLRTYTSIRFISKRQFVRSHLSQRRNVSYKSFHNERVQRLKVKDNVPDEYELIYRNQMTNYLFYAQLFSTVFAGIVITVLVVKRDIRDLKLNVDTWNRKPGHVENEIYIYLGVFVVVCVLIQLFVSKMPLRVYSYPKQKDYIVVFYGTLPGMTKRLACKLNEIRKIKEVGILPWRDSWYEVENKGKMILLENWFRTPADLNIILGYQKGEEDDD